MNSNPSSTGILTTTGQKNMSKAMILRKLNQILAACGVNRFLSSTKMYQKPSLIHVISLEDLKFLIAHRTLLLRESEINCDFRSLSVIFWSMLQDGDRVLNELLHGGRIGVRVSSSSSSDSLRWWKGGTFSAEEKQNILNVLERTAFVSLALTTLLFPNARFEIQMNVVVGAEDVERTVSLAEKLNQLYLNVAAAIEGSVTATVETLPPYDAATHQLFVQVESCYLHVQQLLVELPRRKVTDVEIIVKEIYRPEVWEASGLSLRSTIGFAKAVRQLVVSTAHRNREFSGLSSALGRLVQNRLLRRPPYRHHPFRLSYQLTQANPNDKGFHMLDWTFGVLEQFWAVKAGLESILCPGFLWFPVALMGTEAVRLTSEERGALREVSKATRITFLLEANKLQEAQKRLSYYQLLGYALFEGMPSVDLTKLGEMILRAQDTNLIAMGTVAPYLTDPKYKWGEFLRLLIATCFTVRRDAGIGVLGGEGLVTHDPLPLDSILPLFDSVAEFIFQEPHFQQHVQKGSDSKSKNSFFSFCSPFSMLDALYVHPLLNLIAAHADLINAGRGSEGTTFIASTKVLTIVGNLQSRLDGLVMTLYTACAQAQRELNIGGSGLSLKALQERIPFQAFLRYTNIVELTTVVLRRATQVAVVQAVFPQALLPAVLDTTVRLFAVYNLQIAKMGNSSREQEKTLKLFTDLLRYIPSVMKVQDVNNFFIERLVPLVLPSLACTEVQRKDGKELEVVAVKEEIAYALLEGLLIAFSTPTAAYVITDENFLRHWAAVGVACISNIPDQPRYFSVVKAGHDFYTAAFLSKRCLAPLLMPTFLAVMMPAKWNGYRYRTPKLPLSTTFAASLRYVCQCLMECDGEKLRRQLEDPSSVPRQLVANSEFQSTMLSLDKIPSSFAPEADGSTPPQVTSPLQRITPTNVVLLVVSSLFDKICQLLHLINSTTAGQNSAVVFSHSSTNNPMPFFPVYFSALVNQLQVANVEVFPRVCASVEATLLEHMKSSRPSRALSLKYVGTVVSQTTGPLKKDAAEWYLNLSQMMKAKMMAKL